MHRKAFEILLAEDNPADAELIRAALQKHDVTCELHVLQDGATAMEFLSTLDNDLHMPGLDLCILDIHLPKRSGEDVLERLRSTPKYAQTPVVLMSGVTSPSADKAATRHAGTTVFLKPLNLDEYLRLGAIVSELLSNIGGAHI